MAKIRPAYEEVRIPFTKMTFAPDVPSTALGPNEYNSGRNVETDVRGIRSISGDEEILATITGTPTYISGGFRPYSGETAPRFYTIVATTEGKWWATSNGSTWNDITPLAGVGTYTQAQNITESWNGIIPFFNDEQNAPFFWPYDQNDEWPKMTLYSQLQPLGIDLIAVDGGDPSAQVITLDATQAVKPYFAGDRIVISGVNQFYDGTFEVKDSTTTSITYYAVPSAAYPGGSIGSVAPLYSWNYNPNWASVYAKFMRLYNTPNVGNILVAGNLVATPQISVVGNTTNGSPTLTTAIAATNMVGGAITGPGIPANTTVSSVTVGVSLTLSANATASGTNETFVIVLTTKELFPVTVQWSQAFGLNDAPQTWEPTITNVANQLEVPLRGEAIDGFPCNGQFFISSYWDTIVLSPINYTTTAVPILGVRLANQGRGMLTSNCWANTDKLVYGIDARDVWVFDGQDFTGIGNQRVKNFLFNEIDPDYVDRIYVETNTQKNQIEIYYSDTDATVSTPLTGVAISGTAGQFTCTAAALSVGQTVVVSGTLSGSGTITGYTSPKTYYVVATNGSTTFTLSATAGGVGLTTTAGTTTGLTFAVTNFGVPNKMISYRYDIDCWNAPRSVSSATMACETPVRSFNATTSTWDYDKASRTIQYARGITNSKVVQKDQGYSFINSGTIQSAFRRDNIKLLTDYSGKLMVHRLLPEAINLTYKGLPITPGATPNLEGTISVQVEGSNSVGQPLQDVNSEGMTINTDYPWIQITQNSHRVNSLELGNTSSTNIWLCSATTWQYTQVEDDR